MSSPSPAFAAHLARFGLSAFRPGQEEVIATVLSGQDCLCVMPTGGGKSLCYQLPAVATEGLTLVISPLIALMKDQVDQLVRLGISATYINSTLDPAEQYDRLDRMAAGEYALVYVVPERFRSPRFVEALRRQRLARLAIDEAHCISQWGHDFRPDYLKIGRFRKELGNPPTIALTATATAHVRDDIIERLALEDPRIFVTGFDRHNLFYEVQSPSNNRAKDQALVDFVQSQPGSGIIYAATRKGCEEVAETLKSAGRRKVGVYHAGMTSEDRHRAQDLFMGGKTPIVVATNAFGMGIDKADVRFVVHYNLPGSLEAYYQEAGRAGRDQQPSHCLLLYSNSDYYIQEFFIESAYPSPEVVEQVYEFLGAQESDPIELSQMEIKEALHLDISPSGVGTCETLLEEAGVLERLEARQNQAIFRLTSDLPTAVDLLPVQATVQRRVLATLEKIIGRRRHDTVYFHPQDVAALSGLDLPAVRRALAQLRQLACFDYIPPFRGRAVRLVRSGVPFEELGIDFATQDARKQGEYQKLDEMINYARLSQCRQQEILRYFGQPNSDPCGHCDNCAARGHRTLARTTIAAGSSTHEGDDAAAAAVPPAPAGEDPALLQAVRMALAGVARCKSRFGKGVVAQMLTGSSSEKMSKFRLTQLSTYGILKPLLQTEVNELLDSLITVGLIVQDDVERHRPVVGLSARGVEVMQGQMGLGVELRLTPELRRKIQRSFRAAAAAAAKNAPTNRESPAVREAQVASGDRADAAPKATARPATPPAQASTSKTATWGTPSRSKVEADDFAAEEEHTLATVGVDEDEIDDDAIPEPEPAAPAAPAGTAAPRAIDPRLPAADPLAEVPLAARPAHYWTWRLLSAGFTAAECATCRQIAPGVVLDHAERAREAGWKFDARLLLAEKTWRAIEALLDEQPSAALGSILRGLPLDTPAQAVRIYLEQRGQRG